MSLLDRILNPLSLILINILIIIAAEFTGEGMFFMNTGLIHGIAILFIILAVSRIFFHYYTYDPFFEKIVHGVLGASIIFSISHIYEYASMNIYHTYKDSTFINAVNFYIIGFMLIIIGTESFLRIPAHRSTRLIKMLIAAISLFAILVIAFTIKSDWASLETDSPLPFIYAFLVLAIGTFGIFIIRKLKKMVPIAANFSNYLLASLSLIIFATVPYIFYEFIEEEFYAYTNRHQIIYFSHFAFFAALSLLFLAFTKVSWGGLYAEARQHEEKISNKH